ncbi:MULTISPECIES: cytochrome b/b6 domain-containing protein [unclassified Yoonia]|uniref:cytochrome b/b6 domain-containing protein n=1 Tax=unclassified Yoonia TaxID=2629118 RepID=UPI002AFEE4AD|nr:MULTISPECIES: cytochrome b/b6 domain-containing protein [unclassified Yoonia]
MPAANTAQTYGSVTKTFHWLTALLILALVPLGLIANALPYETDAELALKAQVFSVHKTLGVLVFFVALARIIWAVSQPKPGDLNHDKKAQSTLAAVVHWTLYISLFAVPLSGWVHHAATSGFAPIWWPFGQGLPFVPLNETVAESAAALHWLFSKIMIASILLHVAGALKHHFIDKDATLRRMWFGRADAPQVPAHRGGFAAPLAAVVIFALATGGAAAAGLFSAHESAPTEALATVSSEWTVTEGEIGISVTQLGSDVQGSFGEWTAAISFDPDATGAAGEVMTTIAIQSLTLGSVTSQAMGADFFDAATFPTATFTGTIIEEAGAYIADGVLAIKGSEMPVSFPFDLVADGDVAQMSGTLTLDRRDFGIGASMADESSLGFAVDVTLAVTATR